jgi:hypothetical protein
VYFHGEPTNPWGGLALHDLIEGNTLQIDNVTFQDCYLITYTYGLNITNCNFTRSGIRPYVQNISISNSHFPESYINLVKPQLDYGYASISNCNLSWTDDLNFWHGILLEDFDEYSIKNCFIDGFTGDGIRVWRCGTDVNGENIIEYDTVINSAQTWQFGAMAGISIIESYATIHNNFVENNDRGIVSIWNSNVDIHGDWPNVTQRVINNTINQVWSTRDAFPFEFKLNEMHSVTNPPYHIVYMSTSEDVRSQYITWNCWGPTFNPNNPQAYFYPIDKINWYPNWYCDGGDSIIAGEDELLYKSAQLKVENNDYYNAENEFLNLVEYFPNSKYAIASLKELYRLEDEIGNDYDALRTYLETDSIIQTNDELKNTADKLSISCEVRTEDYSTAMFLLEDIVNDSLTDFEDSLYAICKMEYINYLIDNGNEKSIQIFSPEISFTSKDLLDVETNRYLPLLFKNEKRQGSLELSIKAMTSGELLQNVPNPFYGSTEIYYKLQSDALINIKIYSYTGQLIKEFIEGKKGEGVHYIIFTAIGLEPGLYFSVLETNGRTSNSKKMVIMK